MPVLGLRWRSASGSSNHRPHESLTSIPQGLAISFADTGPVNGRQAIETYWEDQFKQFHHSNEIVTVDENSPHVIRNGWQ